MYIAVDIGGTKTLIASFSNDGKPHQEVKFPTPQDYQAFLKDLKDNLSELSVDDFRAAGVGVPGLLDRDHGVVMSLGNLPWRNEPIQADIEKIVKCPVVVENDAKMAGLSEALEVINKYKRVVYITVSTGIGISLIDNGIIDTSIGDLGGKGMELEHEGEFIPWEEFASGKAIVKKYGKRASEIIDKSTWQEIARNLTAGIVNLIAILEPDIIIVGGGVGTHFKKYGDFVIQELKRYETVLMLIPPIIQAKRPEEAVIYGCFALAKQTYGRHS
jgi:glucokinase